MSEEPKDVSHAEDPVSYMLSVAIELNEMKYALIEAGFTSKEALYIVGQAVAAGVMMPISDFGPDDIQSMNEFPSIEDDENYPEDGGDFLP